MNELWKKIGYFYESWYDEIRDGQRLLTVSRATHLVTVQWAGNIDGQLCHLEKSISFENLCKLPTVTEFGIFVAREMRASMERGARRGGG